jgi:hypothetical protein
MSKLQITMGADPEMFLSKDGDYVAVQPYIDGTKDNPQMLPSRLGNAQRDNVAIEFGVKPAASKLEFIQNIGTTLKELMDLLPEGVELNVIPSAHFPKAELTHMECQEFGCSPDFNAWTMDMNDVPEGAAEGTFRSCGGHIHIGMPEGYTLSDEWRWAVIRGMDTVLGILATFLDSSDAAVARRELYGKAGCYRPTDYGVEYRSLSNFWIKSPKLVELMYDLTNLVVNMVEEDTMSDVIANMGGGDRIQQIINEGWTDNAIELFGALVVNHMDDTTIDLLNEIMDTDLTDANIKTTWKEIMNND